MDSVLLLRGRVIQFAAYGGGHTIDWYSVDVSPRGSGRGTANNSHGGASGTCNGQGWGDGNPTGNGNIFNGGQGHGVGGHTNQLRRRHYG
jgi:hypothetical protein